MKFLFPFVFIVFYFYAPIINAALTTIPSKNDILQSIKIAANAALRNQYSSGAAKCDYHLLQSKWFDYERLWHTGQLSLGLLKAAIVLGPNDIQYNDFTRKAILAANWWIYQKIDTGPCSGLVNSTDIDENGYGCITDACGITEDLTDVSDGSHSLFEITKLTKNNTYADIAANSAIWQLEHMQVSNSKHPGLYYNVVNLTTGNPITENDRGTSKLENVSRSNIEGSLFLDTCKYFMISERENRSRTLKLHKKLCDSFFEQANETIQHQDKYGLWMLWTPNDSSNNRFHPRFNVWYALSLLDAADFLNTSSYTHKFYNGNNGALIKLYVNASIRTAETYAFAQQESGTIYYWNQLVDIDKSKNKFKVVPEKNAPCGSGVAVSLSLWLRLYIKGYGDKFSSNIIKSVKWLIENQFSETHADLNLAGAYFEVGFRKIAHWVSENTLDVVQRDLATNIGLQALSDYIMYCNKNPRDKIICFQ